MRPHFCLRLEECDVNITSFMVGRWWLKKEIPYIRLSEIVDRGAFKYGKHICFPFRAIKIWIGAPSPYNGLRVNRSIARCSPQQLYTWAAALPEYRSPLSFQDTDSVYVPPQLTTDG